MPIYKNLDGDSGIASYECGPGFIAIRFKEGRFATYWYTDARPGARHVEAMKRLAEQGRGLNDYINRNLPRIGGYARRE
ncbi:hypothetical protein ACMX25_12415 [Caballeronia sp. 15715]|uniref:hypothetical protein n=1 Tax=Caballeronia sp. 15715 TaxID=3391030 RepID=UPI0039E69B94